ncbi:manganese efflux pump [Clostridium psychrophilum]|uniref:manganese efflux pump n=1 Tax=Clostridium psychrophilum TaxID=132926 RepID=UPI001C0B1A99|nr:manganese efflux pump [Clostridium psychrophilum]MBU3181846.1 manganese efflux pump [Clostridium psychrophilum]
MSVTSVITVIAFFILTLTLSVDDFSVGVAYGLYKTKLSYKSLMILVLGSATSTYGVMLIGKFIFTNMPDYVTTTASVIILGSIGCKMIYNGWKEKENYSELAKTNPLATIDSKSVSFFQTYLVGLGLGVDDFAQALGLAVAGFPIVITVCLLEVAEVIALLSGNLLALKGFSKKINGKLNIIPGVVLLAVALYQVFF